MSAPCAGRASGQSCAESLLAVGPAGAWRICALRVLAVGLLAGIGVGWLTLRVGRGRAVVLLGRRMAVARLGRVALGRVLLAVLLMGRGRAVGALLWRVGRVASLLRVLWLLVAILLLLLMMLLLGRAVLRLRRVRVGRLTAVLGLLGVLGLAVAALLLAVVVLV